ncbi:VanW family protein [Cellulomonas sp. S1-8]|uniref:VanW family protein n=1 Tax=Cellulomonas sp. S1-8 TaxID=2904790 RepID=UPI002244A17C|nr:VanW family protein [Cellulomonas sp. S1-8]UZN04386.1 VanW family protein [Cellulomonas sp. S1-8]
MTHGTDRDTPTDDSTDRGTAAVPAGSEVRTGDGTVVDGVSDIEEPDARPAGEDVTVEDVTVEDVTGDDVPADETTAADADTDTAADADVERADVTAADVADTDVADADVADADVADADVADADVADADVADADVADTDVADADVTAGPVPTAAGTVVTEPAAAPGVDAAEPDAVAAEPAAVEPAAVEPAAVEPDAVEPDAVEPAAVEPDAAEPAAAAPGATGPVVDTTAEPAGHDATGDRRPRVVAASRPPAPPTGAPMAAWPSWDDVAVTAPEGSDVDRVVPVVADADLPADPAAEVAAPAADVADPAAVAADPTTDTVASGDEKSRTGPPPVQLGGLSALAFTALNAASVGVAAHALAKSPLPGADERAAAGAPDAAGASAADGAAAAAAQTPAAADAPGLVGDDSEVTAGARPDATADEPDVDGPDTAGPDTAGPAEHAPDVDGADTDGPDAHGPVKGSAAVGTVPVVPAAAAGPAGPAVDETAVLAAAGTVAVARTGAPAPAPEDLTTRAVAVVPTSTRPPSAGDTRPAPGSPFDLLGDDDEESPLDVFEPEDGRSRWPRALAITGGAIVLVAALYVGAAYALADRVPRGATVAGVEIGAMSSDEAEEVLASELADRTTSAVPVVAQDVQAELDPAAAGLQLDTGATVARLTGVDLAEPVRLWRHLVGIGAQPPVTQVDQGALDAALTELGGSLTLAPVDGTVVFADGAAHATAAADGWELDASSAAAVLEDGWLTELRPVVLPTTVVAPAVTEDETQRALAELAQPLAAAPVTVQVGDRQAVLDVATLTAHASLVPVDGVLALQLNGQALADAVLGQVPDLLTTASDARFEFQGGAPVIVPGTPGTTLDAAALAPAVALAATAGTDRVASVELVQSDPAETTAALEALGVKEIVSEFSTPLTSEPRRTGNIATGLGNISGTLVRPGETFSLTEALGPIDAAHGFVEAGAIVNGEHRDAWGGGLSQVSTTTYNAGYFAGFEDVEHTPHSEWFQRYPEGREATIFTGVIDMKWKNNTPYGALVQGFVADGRAHVRIWSTKHFTVETEKSGRSGVVSPTTVYSQSATCEPQSAGNPGFTVTNTRRVLLAGEVVDTESHTWKYKAQNRVVCGTAPEAPPAP